MSDPSNPNSRQITHILQDTVFFGLETNQILIAHDELDLPNAETKLKDSGGHGGHNGLRNIID